MIDIDSQLEQILPTDLRGSVAQTLGTTAAVADFPAPIGALVEIERSTGAHVEGEVIGFRDHQTLVAPMSGIQGIRRGSRVSLKRTMRRLGVGPSLLGRVVDAHGQVLDGRPQPATETFATLEGATPSPTERPPITEPLATGVRAIDAFVTCGRGQRMGIFAGSGVGKSVLLGMMARYTEADVNVIALIGERGREVNEFIERDLARDGLARSVVVVATSDEPAIRRVHAAGAATAVAEYFRDQGKDVLLLMDSITRLAMAQREIGLSAGEPPTTRGYPPSTFAMLPKIVERAGRTRTGSITGLYSVLVEGDDENEPIADTMRGLLDGHTWLSRKLASGGHYPAIDVLPSISRLMNAVVPEGHREAAVRLRQLLAAYRDNEDMISIGAYRRGSDPLVDQAIAMRENINNLLKQTIDEPSTFSETQQMLAALVQGLGNTNQVKPQASK